MLKKKKFNIKISKILLSINKRIESFFNLLRDWNSNKKKYLDSWRRLSDKKIFIASVAIFILVITYFLLPAFYSEKTIISEFKNQILQKYNLEVKFNKSPKYRLFPKPHFLLKEVKIVHDSKVISNSKNVKFYISTKNNLRFNKINIKNLVFLESDFKINKKNSYFFYELLNNKVYNQNIKFIKNKLFYLDQNENVVFLSDISKLNYTFQENLINKLKSKLNTFNLPINLKVEHDLMNRNIFTKVDLNSLKLKIENNLNYNNTNIEGDLNLNYINKNQIVKYSLKDNNVIFNTIDNKLTGEINLKPFFLSSNLNLRNIKIKDFFGSNSILINLFKSEILNNKNLNGEISIVVDGLNDLKHINQIKLDIRFEEGLILISNLDFIFKDSTIFNFNNVSLVVDENRLKFIGDVLIEFKNINIFYSHFQIIRNFRKNIKQIESNFVYNFDDELFEFDDLKISGIDKKISDQYLNKFNSEKKDLFNKVTFRNTVRDFFKIISSD